MLNLFLGERHRNCNGQTRRDFLRVGTLGAAGLSLSGLLAQKARAKEKGDSTRDTSVILVWLDGGPTHMDTYDIKTGAPVEYRGPFKAIRTNAPGVEIGELLPRQARVMDKLAVVRSLTHTTGDHFAGAHWMLTGYLGSNAARLDPMYPSAGSITAKVRGANRTGMPAYVGIPYAMSVGLRPGYNSAAYLSTAFNPFEAGGDPNSPAFTVRNLTLPGGMTVAQMEDRKRLHKSFDTMRRDLDRSGMLGSMDRFQQDAYELISGPSARKAFDINQEEPRLRDRYGRHNWGQSCLLARRLVEAGVTFVTVHLGGWDDHAQIEKAMQGKLPPYDKALAALVEDLSERGLYDKTAVFVCGEFGRTPRINPDAGRDHWGQSGFALLGGGGLKTGLVVGSTTDKGEAPRDRAVSPADLLATVYHVLGIDTREIFYDKAGRPVPILSEAKPIRELV